MQPTSAQPEPPALLSPTDAAKFLGVNVKTVHQLMAEGLPHQRLTKRIIRIRRDDLLAYGRVKH